MNLSPRQIELVRSTFAVLEPKARLVALAYFQKVCGANPGLRAQLARDVEAESERLVRLLRAAAECAGRPVEFPSVLARHARGCVSYDAGGPRHAEAGEALLWSLATTLGREFTPEAHAAWAQLHANIGEAMGRSGGAGNPFHARRPTAS